MQLAHKNEHLAMTVQVSVKSLEQKPRYNFDIKILTPGELQGLERSSTSKFHDNQNGKEKGGQVLPETYIWRTPIS